MKKVFVGLVMIVGAAFIIAGLWLRSGCGCCCSSASVQEIKEPVFVQAQWMPARVDFCVAGCQKQPLTPMSQRLSDKYNVWSQEIMGVASNIFTEAMATVDESSEEAKTAEKFKRIMAEAQKYRTEAMAASFGMSFSADWTRLNQMDEGDVTPPLDIFEAMMVCAYSVNLKPLVELCAREFPEYLEQTGDIFTVKLPKELIQNNDVKLGAAVIKAACLPNGVFLATFGTPAFFDAALARVTGKTTEGGLDPDSKFGQYFAPRKQPGFFFIEGVDDVAGLLKRMDKMDEASALEPPYDVYPRMGGANFQGYEQGDAYVFEFNLEAANAEDAAMIREHAMGSLGLVRMTLAQVGDDIELEFPGAGKLVTDLLQKIKIEIVNEKKVRMSLALTEAEIAQIGELYVDSYKRMAEAQNEMLNGIDDAGEGDAPIETEEFEAEGVIDLTPEFEQ